MACVPSSKPSKPTLPRVSGIEASLPYGTTMRCTSSEGNPEDIPWSTVAAINLSTPSLNDHLGLAPALKPAGEATHTECG